MNIATAAECASEDRHKEIVAEAVRTNAQRPSGPGDLRSELYAIAARLRDLSLPKTNAVHALMLIARSWSLDANLDELTKMVRDRLPAEWDFPAPPLPETPAASSGIPVRTHADRVQSRTEPPPMIVQDLLPEGGLGAIIALPGEGKTLVITELSRCVAASDPFAGRNTCGGIVLYLATDAPASTERRMLAMPADVASRIYTITDAPLLPGGLPALREAIERVQQMAGEPVRLVILDTWDSIREHTSDGYAGQDGGAETLMRGLRQLATDLHLAFVIAHHATRNDGGRARGTVVFDARCDWIAVVERTADGVSLRSTKARDGERGPVGTWSIQAATVGDRPVPVLIGGSPAKPADVTAARDQELLARIVEAAEADEVATTRGLQQAVKAKSTSTVQRGIDRLRAAGLVGQDSLRPTRKAILMFEGMSVSGVPLHPVSAVSVPGGAEQLFQRNEVLE